MAAAVGSSNPVTGGALLRGLKFQNCRSQWSRGLRRRSAAARLLRSWVRIPLWAWMFVCCECCKMSGRGLCDGLITHPEESYRLWCVVLCDLETSFMRRPWPTGGLSRQKQKKKKTKFQNCTTLLFDLFNHSGNFWGPSYNCFSFVWGFVWLYE